MSPFIDDDLRRQVAAAQRAREDAENERLRRSTAGLRSGGFEKVIKAIRTKVRESYLRTGELPAIEYVGMFVPYALVTSAAVQEELLKMLVLEESAVKAMVVKVDTEKCYNSSDSQWPADIHVSFEW